LPLTVACFCFMFKSGHGLEGLFKLTLTNCDAILHCRRLLATLPNTLERGVRFCWHHGSIIQWQRFSGWLRPPFNKVIQGRQLWYQAKAHTEWAKKVIPLVHYIVGEVSLFWPTLYIRLPIKTTARQVLRIHEVLNLWICYGEMAIIARYFTEFGSFRGALLKRGW